MNHRSLDPHIPILIPSPEAHGLMRAWRAGLLLLHACLAPTSHPLGLPLREELREGRGEIVLEDEGDAPGERVAASSRG